MPNDQGIQGVQGFQGIQGIQGIPGGAGIQGEGGPTGPQGATGLQGIQGEAGPQGATGQQGIQGEAGAQGEVGPAGSSSNFDNATSTIYVATTGNDTTGNGTVNAPYLTLARAMQDLPLVLRYDHTISIADGTYAEPLNIRGFLCLNQALLTIKGNTTTPTNVKFTGTVNGTQSVTTTPATYGCLVQGEGVRAKIMGIEIHMTTADYGAGCRYGAYLAIDRSTITGHDDNNGMAIGLLVSHKAEVEFMGNVTINRFATEGIFACFGSRLYYTAAGTLTVSRQDSFGYGIHLFAHSSFICYTPSTNITITGVKIAWQLGLNALFQHLGPTSTLSASNANTPQPGAGIQCTDLSSWSTNQTLSLNHFQYGFELNSISYAEAVGSRSILNCGTNQVSQNSVISLP